MGMTLEMELNEEVSVHVGVAAMSVHRYMHETRQSRKYNMH